jgi:hypothetical protein
MRVILQSSFYNSTQFYFSGYLLFYKPENQGFSCGITLLVTNSGEYMDKSMLGIGIDNRKGDV